MAVRTAAGVRVYIGSVGADDDVLVDYTGDTYEEIGEIENAGEAGDEFGNATFTALANRRVRKFKTSADAGTMTIVVGDDASDDGQAAVISALASDFHYRFKVELNDALTVSGDPTTLYFGALVMSNRRNIGDVENIIRKTFNLGINTEIFETAAS